MQIGELLTTGTFSLARGIILAHANGADTLAAANGTTATYTGVISDTSATDLPSGLTVGDGTHTGTVVLTATNTYSLGNTNISPLATLQIGNGGNTGSIIGNVGDAGTLAFNRNDTITFPGTVTGAGALNQMGPGTLILTGPSDYTGATTVSAGTLEVEGSLVSNTAVTVQSLAVLSGHGTIAGGVTILTGGHLAPTAALGPQALTVGSLTLSSGSILDYVLSTPTGVNSLVATGDLNLAGVLNVANGGGFGQGTYRLINYTGDISGTTLTLGTLPPGFNSTNVTVSTATPDQVNLIVGPAFAIQQFWDGPNTTFNMTGPPAHGGSGTWDNTTTNFNDNISGPNAAWGGGIAVFGTLAGTVTLGADIAFQGMEFAIGGYTIVGGGFTLNPTGAAEIATDSGIATISAPIAGAGSLIKSGPGTLILSGTNTYSGGTTVTAGILSVADDTNLGGAGVGVTLKGGELLTSANATIARTIDVSALGTPNTLAAANGTTATYSGVISDSGSLTIGDLTNTGTIVFTVDDTYFATTITARSTLRLGNGGAVGSLAGNVIDNGNFAFNRIDAGLILSGNVSGTGALSQIGTGTTNLSGDNSYSGPTTVSVGTLQAGATTAFSPNSAFTVNSTLDLNGFSNTVGSLAGGGNVTNTGATPVILTAGGDNTDTTFSGTLTNGTLPVSLLGLTKTGNGKLILTGTNTYTGGTTISGGTLQIGNGGAVGSITGGVIDNGNFAFNRSDTALIFSGNVSGTGTLGQIGTGMTTLSGENTYSGATTVSAGTLRANSTTALSPNSAFTVNSTLDLHGNSNAVGSLAGSGTVTNNNADLPTILTAGGDNTSTTFSGILTNGNNNSLGLTKVGLGTMTLTGTNTYTGGTIITGGTLQIGNAGTSGSIVGTVTDNATLSFNRSDIITFSNIVSGSGSLSQIGTGTLILTGSNNYLGGTTISAGTLQIGNGGTIGSITGNVTDNSHFAFDRSDTLLTFTGNISGSGTLSQLGLGTLILSGVNTYSGVTTVSFGTLQAGSNTAFSPNSAFTVNSVLNLAGFSNTVGSLAGSGTVTNNVSPETTIGLAATSSGTPAILTAGDDGTNTIFSGTLIDGTASLGLTKAGLGTLTLSGPNTYTGGTTISGGTLQIGNGGTTGSIVGNVTDNSNLVFDRSDAITFPGVVSGTGSLTKLGSGTLTLPSANTYSGGTLLQSGTLVVDNAAALGTGNVSVNGGTLATEVPSINVLGSYTQNAGGTLQLRVAGANVGQYDSLNVHGNASVGGTLQLISLGFAPVAGNQLNLVSTGGTVSGRFAQFVDPFVVGPAFNTIDLVYGLNSVVLKFLNVTTPIPPVITTIDFQSFAAKGTSNERASAGLLDQVELDPGAASVVDFMFKEPEANYLADFAKISPDVLSSLYEIGFSNSNIQRLNLEDRLDAVRNGANGFSSNMNLGGAKVYLEQDGTVDDGKGSKNPVQPVLAPSPENRWGVWVSGFGDFVNVDGDGNGKGYNFTTGGVSVGIDFRLTDQLVVGLMGDYSHTWTNLKPGHLDVDSGRGGVYASWFDRGFYLDGAIYAGHNSYDTARSGLDGLATGGTEGSEWSAFLSGGYDFHFGNLTIGPIGALQYTEVNIDGFSEKGSVAPMAIHEGSEESLRSDIGFRTFYQWQVGKVIIEPSLKATWEHEYKYSALPITAGFAGVPGPSGTFFGPSEGHDSAVVDAGISVQWTPTLSTYVNYDGQLGRGNYDSNAVTGGVKVSF